MYIAPCRPLPGRPFHLLLARHKVATDKHADKIDNVSSYRRNFETDVVARLQIARARNVLAAVLIPAVLTPVFKLLDSFMPKPPKEWEFWVLVIQTLPIFVSTIYFAIHGYNPLMMHRETVKRGFEKQLKAFLFEAEAALRSLGQDRAIGRNFKFPTVPSKELDQLEIELRKKATGKPPDLDSFRRWRNLDSYDDELRVLDLIDRYASKLRSNTLTLEELQVFCTLENVVVIEDVKYLDPMVALKKELDKSYSDVLASFVREEKLGYTAHIRMRATLFFFYDFVTTGILLENQVYQQQLNTRVSKMLAILLGEQKAEPGFNMIWEVRFDAFVAFEYSNLGTCHAVKVFELLCRDRCILEFAEYPYCTYAETAASIAAAAPDGHPQAIATATTATAAASIKYPASEYTVDSVVTKIDKESLRLEDFGENTTYRAGFGPAGYQREGGMNPLFDTKAITVKYQGLLVVRHYYTMPHAGYASWAFYGAKDLDPTALVALIKSSSSNNLISFAELPKEGCKFCDYLKNFQFQLEYRTNKLRMNKLILAPY